MKKRLPKIGVLAVVLPGLGACGGGGAAPANARPDAPVVRDSAGVTIVINPETDGMPSLAVDATPILTIDGGDAGFGLVSDADWLSDGGVVVADAHQRHLRLFGPDGRERATVGRRGEGPGEFESVDRVWHGSEIDASDAPASGNEASSRARLRVWDARLARVTTLDEDGGIAGVLVLQPTGERARPTPLGSTDDGRIIALNDPRGMPEDETYRADLAFVEYDSTGTVSRTLTRVPGAEMWNWVWEMGVTPSNVPFGRVSAAVLAGAHLWVGTNEGYRIDRYDLSGSLVASARLGREARPLTPPMIDAYKSAERAKASSSAVSKGGNDIFGAMAEDAPYPGELPFYDAMLIDDLGQVWVRDYVTDPDDPTRFVLFDADGVAVATAELPARFRAVRIAGGKVLGVWRNALDVEQVRVYRLD